VQNDHDSVGTRPRHAPPVVRPDPDPDHPVKFSAPRDDGTPFSHKTASPPSLCPSQRMAPGQPIVPINAAASMYHRGMLAHTRYPIKRKSTQRQWTSGCTFQVQETHNSEGGFPSGAVCTANDLHTRWWFTELSISSHPFIAVLVSVPRPHGIRISTDLVLGFMLISARNNVADPLMGTMLNNTHHARIRAPSHA
jgi:hypothetical protein